MIVRLHEKFGYVINLFMAKNITFERSFASHPKPEYWSDKNEVFARDVSKSSKKKYWFNCFICYHFVETSANRVNISDN